MYGTTQVVKARRLDSSYRGIFNCSDWCGLLRWLATSAFALSRRFWRGQPHVPRGAPGSCRDSITLHTFTCEAMLEDSYHSFLLSEAKDVLFITSDSASRSIFSSAERLTRYAYQSVYTASCAFVQIILVWYHSCRNLIS